MSHREFDAATEAVASDPVALDRREERSGASVSGSAFTVADHIANPRKAFLRRQTDAVLCAYIQIPFCHTLCKFCCWAAKYEPKHIVGLERFAEPYLAKLEWEIRERAKIQEERERLDLKVIHFGGGTPSVLSAAELGRILTTMLHAYDLAVEDVETIGIEIRPDSVDPAKLRALRDIGFNRVSIGAQTFDADVLKAVGRHLTPEQLFEAYHAARDAGFEDLNVDLLFGLPGQTLDGVREDADTLLALAPAHIDTHPWKPVKTVGGACVLEGGWERRLKVEAARMQRTMFEAAGYMNYNHRCYARPGFENYMHLIEAAYLLPSIAFGAGSEQSTGYPKTTQDVEEYLSADYVPPYFRIERPRIHIDEWPTVFTDYVLRQLLLAEGLWLPGFTSRHDCDPVLRLSKGWEKDFSYLEQVGDLYTRSRMQILRRMRSWFERDIIRVVDGEWLRLDPEFQVAEETWVLYMQAC